ncbi:MAG: class I SAM-dependent methyltransferase [Pseudomonadota bacterium]
MDWEAFFRLHADLPREGPGDAATARRAIAATGLSGPLTVLDLGSGPGAGSLTLLQRLPEAQVTAIDTHAPFLAQAEARVAAAGHAARFRTLCTDMASPPVPPGSVDLIWCEGAIYFLGIAAGLARWRPLLAPVGRVVFSEPVWLTETPSPACAAMWQAEYPPMSDEAGIRAAVARAGYRVIEAFPLGAAAWAAYYEPLAAREAALRSWHGDDAALAEARREIAVWERYGAEYDYLMVICAPHLPEPPEPPDPRAP